MKRIAFSMIVASLLLGACQKENDEISSEDVTVKKAITQKRVACDDMNNRRWTDYFMDCDCTHIGNCMRDIIIEDDVESTTQGIRLVFQALESADDFLIKAEFRRQSAVLLNHLDEALVEGVIDGSVRADSRTNEAKAKKFILFYNSSDELIRVHPFQF